MLCVITDYTVTDFCDFTLISVPSHDVCPFISLPIAGFVNASTEPYTRLPDSAQTQHGRQYPAAWQTGPTRISVPAVQELCREHCSILVQAAVPDDRFEVQNDPSCTNSCQKSPSLDAGQAAAQSNHRRQWEDWFHAIEQEKKGVA